MDSMQALGKYVVRVSVPLSFALVVEAGDSEEALNQADQFVMNSDPEAIVARYLCDFDLGALETFIPEWDGQ